MSLYQSQTQKHLDAGDRNRQLAIVAFNSGTAWCTPPPYEWAITMAFYAALHYIDAYANEYGGGAPASHEERNRFVNSVNGLSGIAPTYNQLYSRSRTARYVPMQPYRKGATESVLHDMRFIIAEVRKML